MWQYVIDLIGSSIEDYPVLIACIVTLIVTYLLHAMMSLISKVFRL